jgi:polar amino acid transport system substrate-binding protein
MAHIIKPAYIVLACLPLMGADLAPTGTLRATFLGNNPVQGTVDAKTGVVSGPVADIVKELARRSGVPYTISPAANAGEVIDRLNSGAADIGFLALEAERARQVDFSGPYLLMGVTYLVPAASPIKTAADADRTGVRIGAVNNQSPTIFLKDHIKNAKLIVLDTQPSYEELLKRFAAGELNAFSGNRMRLVEAAASYPGLRVAQDDFAKMEQNIIVKKGDIQKLKIIDGFLEETRASGFLKDSFSRAKLVGVEAPARVTR